MVLTIYLGCGVLKCRDAVTVAVRLTIRFRYSAHYLLSGGDGRPEIDRAGNDALICYIPSVHFLLRCPMSHVVSAGVAAPKEAPSNYFAQLAVKGLLAGRVPRMFGVAGYLTMTPRL